MAIGDAVAVNLGTAETSRQPSSGVEEQISSIVKNGNTDAAQLFDGTNNQAIMDGAINTHTANPAATIAGRRNFYNMSLMITNSFYLRKAGTADRIYFGGVQTNA